MVLCSVRQDYSTHFKLSQVVKMRDPQEKKPDHPQAELGLPHMWHELGSNSQQWFSGEMSDIEPGPPRSRIKAC